MKELSKDALIVAPRQQLVDTILELHKTTTTLQATIQELEHKLDWFQRQVFGTKSERFVPDDELQTALDLGIDTGSPQNDEKVDISYTRNKQKSSEEKKGHGRGTMPTHLPIIEKIIEPEEDVSDMVCIGQEESWHYDMTPASLHVILTIRPKYAKPHGEGVVTAQLPALPIEKGNAGPGFMTQVVIDKFVYHIPLDRQRKKFRNEYKVSFSESWLCDLVKNVGFWIEPLYKGYIKKLLQAGYICADETPIPVLVKDKRGKTHRGYFWVYYDPLSKITIFDYRKSRSRVGPSEFLKGYTGIIQVDGYDGYNEIIDLNNLVRAACMDHVRRKFEQAIKNDKGRALYALEVIGEWYRTEGEAKDNNLTFEQRFERRVQKTAPSMAAFKQWLFEQKPEVLPKSGIGIAVNYALGQWDYFNAFLSDPRVELSNIATENKIRPVAIGRKNYMFMGSHEAAQRAAMTYSLVTIAQNHSIDPFVYFKEILTQFPQAENSSIIDRFYIPEWKPTIEDNTNKK